MQSNYLFEKMENIHCIKYVLHGTTCVIFKKRSTITIIESNPFFVFSKLRINSKLKSFQIVSNIGKGMYNLVFCAAPLLVCHIKHLSTKQYTSLHIFAQKK